MMLWPLELMWHVSRWRVLPYWPVCQLPAHAPWATMILRMDSSVWASDRLLHALASSVTLILPHGDIPWYGWHGIKRWMPLTCQYRSVCQLSARASRAMIL